MPNPFDGNTQVNVFASTSSTVRMLLVDINGKKCAEYNGELVVGNNLFEISLTIPQVYILQLVTDEGISSLKMVNKGRAGMDRIVSVGNMEKMVKVDLKSTSVHEFELGDEMRYTGYTQSQGAQLQSDVITQVQYESEELSLRFSIIPPLTVTADSIILSGNNVYCYGTVVSGENVTERGLCWHTSTSPTIENTHFACGVGLGSYMGQITGAVPGTTYYVRAYATNGGGTVYGNEVSFISGGDGRPCPGAATVTDIDSNIYNTVLIGNQCWMKENLRTTRYTDSTIIETGTYPSSIYPRRYAPNNDESNVATYGYLYNWRAVKNGICPEGWHVPSDAEWTTLTDHVSNQSQYVCGSDSSYIAKSLAATTGWNNSSGVCHIGNTQSLNNATDFSALPAVSYTTYYGYFGQGALFWRASPYNGHAYYRALNYAYAGVRVVTVNDLYYSVSLRCIRN